MVQTGTGFADTAFKENLSRPIHSWTPWIGGYSAEFVSDVIRKHAQPHRPGIVLDPFCGVGTTLVESSRAGLDSIGIELNPYAAQAAKLKSSARSLDITSIQAHLKNLESIWEEISPDREYPPAFGSREPFFPPENLSQINRILNWIESAPSGLYRDFFSIALGSILVPMSNYTYEPSLSTRSRSGRPKQISTDALAKLKSKVCSMVSDLELIQPESKWGTARVWEGNSLNGTWPVEGSSVDLIITSPPYLNNYHYVRNSRPQLFMLGLVTDYKEIKRLQDENFGKYWQTVRNQEVPMLKCKSETLDLVLSRLHVQKHEKSALYDGAGWAAYAVQYFNDVVLTLERCFDSLADGGNAFFVLGDSYLQGVYVPVQQIFCDIAASKEFTLVECQRVRKRNGGSTIRSRKLVGPCAKFELSEFVIHLRKNCR